MALAIVVVFTGTKVLAQQSRIKQHVISDVILTFVSPDGKEYEARIQRDVLDLSPKNGWKVKLLVRGEEITEPIVPKELKNFLICEQLDKGDVTIGKKNYFCHVLKDLSDGAFLIGNNTCLFEILPGFLIDLCPHPHPHQF
jgi:hypothetical protein